LTVFSSL